MKRRPILDTQKNRKILNDFGFSFVVGIYGQNKVFVKTSLVNYKLLLELCEGKQ